MGIVNLKNIFISYGHEDALTLALKLEKDLISEGHDVWLDKSRMRDGEPWEDQIEEEILNREIFIALLTPHAVERPDGVCRDEISMARYEHRKIIPAMVIKCRPPLGIYRLNWIDFQDWENEHQYKKAFNRLQKMFKEEVVAEGLHARIFSELRKLDFGSEIFDLIKDFTGREWLVKKLNEWLDTEDSRVFFITGDPGIGKSAFIAYLVHNHPQVIACHFCDSDIKDTLDTNLFVKSIAAQLATQLDNYRRALDRIDMEEIISFGDPGTLMRRLIIDPLKSESVNRPRIIVIDALDEILTSPSSVIIKVLRKQLKYFPSWIKLVFSSRKDPKVVDSFRKFNPYEIEASSLDNLNDVRTYLNLRLNSPKISKKLAGKGITKESITEIIYKKSEGNFRYVKDALEGIVNGSLDPSQPEAFPVSLIEFYMSFFERFFPDGQGYEDIRQVLEIILASREPLTAKQIGFFTDLESPEIENRMQRLAPYFPKRVNHFKTYHKALKDWLLGEGGSDTTYRVNIELGNRVISEKLYKTYQKEEIPSFMANYLLIHLPYYLLTQERWSELSRLLSDRHYIKMCLSTHLGSALIRNYLDVLNWLDIPEFYKKKISKSYKKKIRKFVEFIAISEKLDLLNKKIFVSYSHNDSALVDYFVSRVKTLNSALGLGIEFSIAKNFLTAGDNWAKKINEMIKNSDIYLLLWSTASKESRFVQREWEYAHSLVDQKGYGFFRPYYFEDPIPWVPRELNEIHFGNFHNLLKFIADPLGEEKLHVKVIEKGRKKDKFGRTKIPKKLENKIYSKKNRSLSFKKSQKKMKKKKSNLDYS